MTKLTQIKGIGGVTEAKLVSVGYTSVEELSEASASNISEQTNISTKQAKKIIGAAGSYIREFSPTGKKSRGKSRKHQAIWRDLWGES